MLSKNQIAPVINGTSISGEHIDLAELKGKKVLVKFHRFSGCPVAQRQVHDFIQKQNELNAAGIETIIFLHSPKDKIAPVYKEVPGLHIMADKPKKFYRLYHSEFSWGKIFTAGTWSETFKSFFSGFFPLITKFERDVNGVPSDFIINEKGIITNTHYGKHYGDSWTPAEVIANS